MGRAVVRGTRAIDCEDGVERVTCQSDRAAAWSRCPPAARKPCVSRHASRSPPGRPSGTARPTCFERGAETALLQTDSATLAESSDRISVAGALARDRSDPILGLRLVGLCYVAP